jgi:hypothetical protein
MSVSSSMRFFFAAMLLSSFALAQNATTAGTASSPHPTLENLSIVWPITGDANNNGVVSVRYRVMGGGGYRNGLALRRIPAGTNSTNDFM